MAERSRRSQECRAYSPQVHYVGSQNKIVEEYVAGIFRSIAVQDYYIRIQKITGARTLKDGEILV